MAIRVGTANLKKIFIGASEVLLVYVGANLIYKAITKYVSDYSARVIADGGTIEGLTNVTTIAQNLRNSDLFERLTLLFIPSGVKASKAYALLPEDGTGSLTVVRNTTGSRRNSLGFIEVVAANVARFTYLTVGGTPFLLDEEQRTNLVLRSTDLSDSIWNKRTCTVTFNQGISPDGLNNAVKAVRGGNDDRIDQTYNPSNALNHSRSIWAKTVSGTGFTNILSHNSNANSLFFITNEWQKFEVNSYNNTGGTAIYAVDFRGTGNTLSEILVWQPQAEVGAAASSEIFTQGAAVTRNADVITRTPPTGTVKIITTFSDNTTQVLTTIPATYTVPEGLIKSIAMNNVL